MGFRVRKSFKIAPGVRVNVGKKSAGVSFGTRGARVSVNSRTGARATVGIPGSGISYTTSLNSSKKKNLHLLLVLIAATLMTIVVLVEKIILLHIKEILN